MKILIIIILSVLLTSCNHESKEKFNETAIKVESTMAKAVDTAKARISAKYDTMVKSDSNKLRQYDVTLSEYRIDMSQTLRPGNVELDVTNHGTMDHNFEIRGAGVKKTFTPNLKPGETRVLQLHLNPGIYDVYCPLDQHEKKGMRSKVEVKQ